MAENIENDNDDVCDNGGDLFIYVLASDRYFLSNFARDWREKHRTHFNFVLSFDNFYFDKQTKLIIKSTKFSRIWFQDEHDGSQKGRDRVCRNNTNHLVSSYVNVDKEPIFYKNSAMTWVANELILESKYHFFLECMRVPPDWHLWVYFLGDDVEADKYQVTITLFREEGEIKKDKFGFYLIFVKLIKFSI